MDSPDLNGYSPPESDSRPTEDASSDGASGRPAFAWSGPISLDNVGRVGDDASMPELVPRPAVPIAEVFADPSCIDDLVRVHQPYWPVQRYVSNRAEYAALSGASGGAPSKTAMPIAPVFRGDWAFGGEILDGIEPLLGHEPFVEAARTLFDAEIVRPHSVYANLTWQLPYPQGRGHVDIPGFRGFDRTTVPVAFLTVMGLSGLFESERVKVATAVAWFYRGSDGGFEYWPEGPTAPSVVHEGNIDNTAIMGDNDFMWHRVRPLGAVADGLATLTLDSELRSDDGERWTITDPAGDIASFGRESLRVSVSWKADVFTSDADRRRRDDHTDDLVADEVLRRISADLAERGIDPTIPTDDPFRDPDFMERIQGAYMRYPA